MGKRIRAQRKGSSPRYRVSSHRFPGKNRMPREKDIVGEVTELVHSPVHTAPLARVKLPDGDTTFVVATEGLAVGSNIAIGDNVSLRPGNITSLAQIPEGTAINNVEVDLVMVAKSLEQQETPVLLRRNLVTKSVFECRPVPSRNFQAAVEPPSVCLQVMAVMRCHYEQPVLRTTRQRLVVNSSHTLVVLP